MVMFRRFDDEQDAAEIELANGERLLVPKRFVPKGAKVGMEVAPIAAKATAKKAPASLQAGNRAQSLYKFYQEQGLPSHVAAGIVGNQMQESGKHLNPLAVGDNGTAFGISQVRGKRLANLNKFANQLGTNKGDLATQALFTLWEMGYAPLKNQLPVQGAGFGSEAEAGRRVMSAQNVDEAAFAMAGFERPRGWKGYGSTNPDGIHGWNNRLGFAKQLVGGSVGGGASGISVSGNAATASGVESGGASDDIRERLRSLVNRKSGKAVPKKRGGIGDLISGALGGLAAGSEGNQTDIPANPFGTPGQFGAMSSQMASNGPLPALGAGPIQPLWFKDIF